MNWRLRLVYKESMEVLCQFIVWRLLPHKVRYWAVIRAWADATQGQWSNQDATTVRAEQLLKRMR